MENSNLINYIINTDKVSMERIDGETLIINFETGNYFVSSGTGSDILFLIRKGIAKHIWLNILKDYWEIQSQEDTENEIEIFLKFLLDNHLILEIDNIDLQSIELPHDCLRSVWTSPTISVFDDMSELLMIDPIHDSSLEGWPNRKEES